jgi:hypothetical protein
MKRLLLSLITVLVVVGAVTGVLKSHSLSHLGKATMPSIQEQQSAGWARKLPEQDFEDRSLVFPRERTQ